MNERQKDILSALACINCSQISREEWVNIGMALKSEGLTAEDWELFSASDPARYKAGECAKLWKGFKRSGITGNTVFMHARRNGWEGSKNIYFPQVKEYQRQRPQPETHEEPQEQQKAEQIRRLWKILHGHNVNDPVTFYEPGEEWKPEADAVKYLQAVFQPEDIVSFTAESSYDGKKYRPSGTGKFIRSIELIESLKRFKADEIIKYDHAAGIWIRVNPLDGKYINVENVTAYRHVLIESDELSIPEQIYLIHELRLPVTALVYSGNKSIHALVKIQADNAEEYSQRVQFLFDICNRYGLKVDTSNSPANKMCRFPGFIRGDHKQFLIETGTGCSCWAEWENLIKKGLNGIEILNKELNKPLPLKPELIQGLLREGHKMIVSASSKAGKTFLMMNLAVCISEGLEWLGHPCRQGKVLYLNMEIDPASAEKRFIDLCRNMHLQGIPQNIDLMNLRGETQPLTTLSDRIITAVKDIKEKYTAIIIDPLYKVLEGDENSNSDMTRIAQAGDKLAEVTGAAVIYVHHFSKGSQAEKRAIDRPAGAGTFARDPDTALVLTQYDPETTNNDQVYELDYTVREFPSYPPEMIRFNYPLFEKVDPAEYPDAKFRKTGKTSAEKEAEKEAFRNERISNTVKAYQNCEEITASNGRLGVKKAVLLKELLKLYPERGTLTARRNQIDLIEENEALEKVGTAGKETVYRLTMTTS